MIKDVSFQRFSSLSRRMHYEGEQSSYGPPFSSTSLPMPASLMMILANVPSPR